MCCMDLGKQGETRRKVVKVKEALSLLSDVSITVYVQLLSVKKETDKKWSPLIPRHYSLFLLLMCSKSIR